LLFDVLIIALYNGNVSLSIPSRSALQ